MTQSPAPGADLDRTLYRARLAELAQLLRERAPSAWCRAGVPGVTCGCYRCAALRICHGSLD